MKTRPSKQINRVVGTRLISRDSKKKTLDYKTNRMAVAKCYKEGCHATPCPGQVYCSRDHAPLGHYGMTKTKMGWREDGKD